MRLVAKEKRIRVDVDCLLLKQRGSKSMTMVHCSLGMGIIIDGYEKRARILSQIARK